ncbi:MAG: hypothetical protein COW30_02590 [Rhodospirillales bacterium CG15_BIG_FIL_POST_REV_8_21_14_020_66_15]|nr:MAG: hypothetical protein COW30_02590 [Rhodospirillales bacterium CG15_BIG_FIL_POST_REV_8_21_14_020_66_15]
MKLTPFAYTFANTALNGQRVQFELQFNLLQNSLIKRFNDKVETISQTPSSVQHKIDALTKRSQALVDSLPVLQEYRQGQTNTGGALEGIFDEITVLFQTFNSDGTVDADEVAAFEAQRDIVADKINNLYIFSHPDLNDADVIKNLKADVTSIRSLTLVEGTLTPDNDAVTNFLSSLQTEVSIAITVNQNTVSTTLDLEQKIQAEFANVDIDLLKLTSEEQARRAEKINAAEVQLGNLLRAISLSFEINSGLSEALANRLKPFTPPPGSAVNIIS